MWPLGPAGFPEGSGEKSSSSHIGKSTRPANRTPACLPPRSTVACRPEWRPRRASMVSGGAAPGERALHACDPSEACKREPCPRPLMLPAPEFEPEPGRRGRARRPGRPGASSNYVSNPRKTARDRAAYIARHRVNENHGDPLTPGALSRWLLWGESRRLTRKQARRRSGPFRRRFRLQ